MKTKKPGRILSLVLSAVMVLAMLPAVSGTAGAAAIATRTTPLDLATNADISYNSTDGNTSKTANPATASITDTKEGWSWDLPSKTLTLSGANIDCSGNTPAETVTFGIMLNTDSNIVLTEGTTSSVRAGKPKTENSYGVYFLGATGNPTISGKGTLNTMSAIAGGSAGISCQSAKLTIKEATINASSYETPQWHVSLGYGIWCNSLEVQSGTIKSTGITNAEAVGIRADNMTMSGGTVTVTATEASPQGDPTYGILGDNFTMTGGTLYAYATHAIYMVKGTITATGATLTGANGTITDGTTKELIRSGAAPVTIRFGPPPPPTYDVVYNIAAGGSGSRLERSLNTVVTDPNGGVTADDKAGDKSVTLKLTVTEKATVSVPDSEKIEGVKQGDSLQYYDVKVEKTVTTSDGTPTTTVLTSIPKPVQAVIPLSAGIQGKTSYTVYRVHNNLAEKIPNDPTAAEFYTVSADGKHLTLNVRQFSTYAVITNNKSLTGDHTFGDANNPKSSAVDVQGKVIEGNFGVYKLDISWGAMKFDYNAQGKVWNPDTHVYEATGTKGWIKESFEAGNNKITVANHSNGDVWLSYLAKPDAVLTGATMTVRATNSLASVEAKDVLLGKVPSESGTAPTVDTFVWLTGEPTGLKSATYTKAGVITITAEPDTAGGLTPKKP